MAKTTRKTPNYLIMGIFMAVGIVAILVSVIFADKLLVKIRGGYPMYVRFENLDGLVVGSKVIVGSGKDIGQVDDIALDGSQLIVTVFINKHFKINRDATFEILSTSLMGGKHLSVENYTGLEPHYEVGDVVDGVTPVSINSIMSMFGEAFSSGSEEGMAVGLAGIVTSVDDVVHTVYSILSENKSNINITVSNVAEASIHLNSTIANIDRKLASVSDREFKAMLNDTKSSLKNLEKFLGEISSDKAVLSILKDPEITHSIKTIITNLEETTEKVKAKPSLLLRS